MKGVNFFQFLYFNGLHFAIPIAITGRPFRTANNLKIALEGQSPAMYKHRMK